ncbi:MAG: TRIC cation channel family protein, partial [Anaerolineaceae bacterium]
MTTDEILLVMAYLGVVAGAVSGVVAARRKNMDVIGAATVACVTALGGGTVRDLMLGRFPVFWVKEEGYVVVTLLVALITYYSTRLLALTSRSILIPDALGLGVFTVWGTAFG